MKRTILVFLIFTITTFSCRNSDDEVQQIDQILQIYFENTNGDDLLDTTLDEGYNQVKFYDLGAEIDQKPVTSFSLLKDKDTINYIDYSAGAVRNLKDSVNASQKTYQSEMVINLIKTVNNITITDIDTIKIEYNWSPTLFQISKIYYNGTQKTFTKNGAANAVSIVK